MLWQDLLSVVDTGGVEGEGRLRPPVGRELAWVQGREKDVGRGPAWLRLAACGVKRGGTCEGFEGVWWSVWCYLRWGYYHFASYPQPRHHVGPAEPQAAGGYRAHQQ